MTNPKFPFADQVQFEPYWWQAAQPSDSRLDLPDKSDTVVIGGGFTGLSAARTLARAGANVTLLEAREIGWGASSRNGGFIGPEVHTFKTALAYGPERAVAITAEHYAASAFVRDLVTEEKIECHHRATGHFRGAMTPKVYDRMGRYLDKVRRYMPTSAELLPRLRQRDEVGSDLYHGGVLTPDYESLHPGLYVQGLARAAQKAGASIVSGAEVTAVNRQAGGFLLSTARGHIFAKQVLIATDGYTTPIVPPLRRRIIPIRSAMIATEPIAPELMRQLMPKQRMLAGSQRVVTYYRPSPDGARILFGGRVLRLDDRNVELANASHLHKQMTQVFPELRQITVTNYWHGQIGFTFDGLPHLGAMDGCFFALGYNGTGVARASWLGHVIARRMMGDSSPVSAYEGLPMRTRPFYTGKPWFLPSAILLYELMDRWDHFRSR